MDILGLYGRAEISRLTTGANVMPNKYALLTTYPQSGSKNVGDALITESLKCLVQEIREDVTFVEFFRGESLSANLDEINSCDGVLLPGFAIRYNTWPDIYTLTDRIEDIRVPLIGVGTGTMDVRATRIEQAHKLELSEGSRHLLERVVADAGVIATRDPFTQAAVSVYGFRTHMVGDCALYDPPMIGVPLKRPDSIQSIAFTAPRRLHLIDQAVQLIDAVRGAWPTATLTLFRHGRPGLAERTVEERTGLPAVDIYGRDVGRLAEYSQYDLHLGYRVHAHLYRLRSRMPSLLLEEDSRAVGFNRLLGLEGVPTTKIGHPRGRRNLLRSAARRSGMGVSPRRQLKTGAADVSVSILRRYEQTSFAEFEPALATIDWYYSQRMMPYLKGII